MAGQAGILSSEFFTNVILPFLLVFVIIYAILERTKILGEKKDINAIVGMVFALATVALPSAFGAVDVIIKIIPIVAVIMVIILAFMLMYGFVGGTNEKGFLSDPWKRFFAIVLGLALLASVLWATGIFNMVTGQVWASQALQTIILVGSVIAVIAVVLSGPDVKPKST